jgi:TonB family protein
MARRKGSIFGNPVGSSTAEATIGVEDPNFTYGYYLDRIVAVISENWTRPPVGVVDAVLHFRILPDGTVVDLEIRRTSGDEGFDQAALRAVRASSPLPPLPKGYKKDFLGINLIVK